MVSRLGSPPASAMARRKKAVTEAMFAMTWSGWWKAAALMRWRMKRRQGPSPGWVWTQKVSLMWPEP